MTPELEKYYENFFDLFYTPGWEQLMEDVQTSIDTFNIESIESERDLWYAKGRLLQLKTLQNLQATVEQTYEDLKNDSEV